MANETAPAQTILETVSETLGSMVRDGAAFFVDFLRRIASNLAGIAAPIAMTFGLASAGCKSETVDAAVQPPQPKVVAAPVPAEPTPAVEKEPEPIGKFNITFYYMVGEEEVAARSAA